MPEPSNFVLTLTPTDVLGMPIGRVLKTQATEMRSKRRQWARVTAAQRLIPFPLILLTFPPVFSIVPGPAGSQIARSFH